MLGQILFTWSRATELDFNCKRWRLFADVMNDAAMCLELLGAVLPKWTLQVRYGGRQTGRRVASPLLS